MFAAFRSCCAVKLIIDGEFGGFWSGVSSSPFLKRSREVRAVDLIAAFHRSSLNASSESRFLLVLSGFGWQRHGKKAHCQHYQHSDDRYCKGQILTVPQPCKPVSKFLRHNICLPTIHLQIVNIPLIVKRFVAHGVFGRRTGGEINDDGAAEACYQESGGEPTKAFL